MQAASVGEKENKLLDLLKYLAALFVLISHCFPITQNVHIDFFYRQWFFRFCVPFYMISSGYFFASFQKQGKIKYIKRIAILYSVSSLLYLPLYIKESPITVIKTMIFGYYHLWYLSALLISLAVLYLIEKCTFLHKIFQAVYPFAAIACILVGAFYDEYKNIFTGVLNLPLLKKLYICIQLTGGTRHAMFFAFPMILIGKFIYEHKQILRLPKTACIVLTIASAALSLAECIMLRHFIGNSISCDMTLFNFLPAIFLFILTFVWQPKILKNISTRGLRKNADMIYISHKWVLTVVDKLFHVAYLFRISLTLLITVFVSWLYLKISDLIKHNKKQKSL